MLSTRYSLLFLLAALFSTPSLCTENSEQQVEAHVDRAAFQKLLNQIDPPSLHAALHDFSPKKFQHGMFPEDRTAMEAIHKEEPGLATGILKMAKLAKRDNSTVTTTPVLPSTTVSPPAETSSVPTSLPPSSSVLEPTSAPTTTVPSTTQGPSTSTSEGQVITTTDASGNTIITTIGGGATTIPASTSSQGGSRPSSSTSTYLQTSTLSDGQQSTVTAVTVVGGAGSGGATATDSASADGSAGGQPGLQTDEAPMTRGCGREMTVVLGAAVAVAFML